MAIMIDAYDPIYDPIDISNDDFDAGTLMEHDSMESPLRFLREMGAGFPGTLGSDVFTEVQDTSVEHITGTPAVNELYWGHQRLGYNCTVAVQTCILKWYGIDISEMLLTQFAMEQGWLTENGGSFEDLGKVLGYFGIQTHARLNATFDDLLNELQKGHAVIVPVDAGELWADSLLSRLWEHVEDLFGIPDHVIWVTGIDMSNPDDPQVIFNDTGHPDGAGQRYPLSEFRDAWEDADFDYIATSQPPPHYEGYVSLEDLWQHRS